MNNLDFGGGLYDSLDKAKLPEGYIARGLNFSVDTGVVKAGPGFAQIWARAGAHANDRIQGAGFARSGGSEEILLAFAQNGESFLRFIAVDVNAGTSRTFSAKSWVNHYIGTDRWQFQNFGEYIYGVNALEGMIRRKVGGTASGDLISYPVKFEAATDASSTWRVERPDGQYPGEFVWGSGSWAGTASTFATGSFTAVAPGAGILQSPDLVLENVGDSPVPRESINWFVFKFTSGVNLIERRYLFLECEVISLAFSGGGTSYNPWQDSGNAIDQLPRFSDTEFFTAYVTDNGSAVTGGSWTNWKTLPVKAAIMQLSPNPSAQAAGHVVKVGLMLDLDATQFRDLTPSFLTSVRQFAISCPVESGNAYRIKLKSPRVGGTWMNKPTYLQFMTSDSANQNNSFTNPESYYGNLAKTIDYAIVSRKVSPAEESDATIVSIPARVGYGLAPVAGSFPMGTRITVTSGDPLPGFSEVCVFRRRHSDGGKWYKLGKSSATFDVTDSRVDAMQDCLPWNPVDSEILPADHDFGAASQAFKGQNLSAWKGHIAVGFGNEIYLSKYEDPASYVLPYRQQIAGAALDDPAMGSTGWMSDDLSDVVLGFASSDHLYAVGKNGVYVSVGDSAVDSTPFRKMPGTYGGLGSNAMCALDGGVMVASSSGLWWYRAYRVNARTSDADYQTVELTEKIRKSYRELLAQRNNAPVLVAAWRGELWVMAGLNYLRRTRSGAWERGSWSQTALSSGPAGGSPGTFGAATAFANASIYRVSVAEGGVNTYVPVAFPATGTIHVYALLADDSRGLFMVSNVGRIFQISDSYRTHAGYAIPWGIETGSFVSGSRAKVTAMELTVRSDPSQPIDSTKEVRFAVETYDGLAGYWVTALDMETQSQRYKNVDVVPGFLTSFAVGARTAAHELITASFELSSASPGADR